MNILQVSPPKAGSFWLQTILKNILKIKQHAVYSYIEQHPAYRELKQQELSFQEQAGVDMIDIEEDGTYFRVSSIFREEIRSIKDYSSQSSLAWTHSTYCTKTPQVFNYFSKKVIIVRDPRDRALSASRFAFTPYMKKHYPSSYASPEDYLEGEYERLINQWVWFYGNYLLHHEELDLHFVFYERLLNDFHNELKALLNYLEINLEKTERNKIAKEVSFTSMKADSPRHLEKGQSRKWVNQLSQNQKSYAIERAGYLMKILGYPLTAAQEDPLPQFPQKVPKVELLSMLKTINWQELYINT